MIFVTVGTDMPFDRMIRAIDLWAMKNPEKQVFAQIGKTGWKPQYIEYQEFIDPSEFKKRFSLASAVVSHAGMGTILSALHYGKPILVMPRKASLGEQRNEHQLATANRLGKSGKISVAYDEEELTRKLDSLDTLEMADRIGSSATPTLISTINKFINTSW